MKKVLQVVSALRTGGAERVAVELAAGLQARGWRSEIAVVSLQEHRSGTPFDEPLRTEALRRGIFVRDLAFPSIRDRAARKRVGKLLREGEYALLHAHNRTVDWQLAFLSRLSGIPFVYTRHLPYGDLSGREKALYLGAALTARKVIAISKTVEAHLLSSEKTPARKIRLIENGVDVERIKPLGEDERKAKRKELGLGESDFAWLLAARLARQKGQKYLLEAFARLPAGSRSVLLLAGEGPDETELKTLAQSLSLGERVRFLGLRRDVPELLGAADGFACASLSEGLPLAIIEALAAGLPIVAPRLSSIEDLEARGAIRFFGEKHGAWASAHDPAEIAKAVLEIEKNPIPAPLLIQTRDSVRRKYAVDAMVEAHERLYREILGV
ncbi:MAG: glycosyltransferase [Bdellovibrionota bacterium]